jgi:hypothetical protein
MPLADDLYARLESLVASGKALISRRQIQREYGPEYWVDTTLVSEAQSWIASSANLISHVALSGSYFVAETDRITKDDELRRGASWTLLLKMQGLLVALREEAAHGLLGKIEYTIVATTFDDFLDHAADFHKGNKVREAGVLASIVLEDALKKIAAKNGLTPAGMTLEPLIDDLTKAGVFTSVKAKRIKGYASVRNSALHAEWEKFDIRDVGEVISGTRELLESHLS